MRVHPGQLHGRAPGPGPRDERAGSWNRLVTGLVSGECTSDAGDAKARAAGVCEEEQVMESQTDMGGTGEHSVAIEAASLRDRLLALEASHEDLLSRAADAAIAHAEAKALGERLSAELAARTAAHTSQLAALARERDQARAELLDASEKQAARLTSAEEQRDALRAEVALAVESLDAVRVDAAIAARELATVTGERDALKADRALAPRRAEVDRDDLDYLQAEVARLQAQHAIDLAANASLVAHVAEVLAERNELAREVGGEDPIDTLRRERRSAAHVVEYVTRMHAEVATLRARLRATTDDARPAARSEVVRDEPHRRAVTLVPAGRVVDAVSQAGERARTSVKAATASSDVPPSDERVVTPALPPGDGDGFSEKPAVSH